MAAASRAIALVTPWFGGDDTNGSELLSSQLVRDLFAPRHRVDVLTTCARSFGDDWSANYYREGSVHEEHYTVRRFRVGPRDAEAFNRANAFLLSQPLEFLKEHPRAIPSAIEQAFCTENIGSPGLLQYLSDWGRTYSSIIFTPYPYGPALNGLERVSNRAFLQPCLHDEAYAYLPATARMFRAARGLLFNSTAEFKLACELYGPDVRAKGAVVGHWVDEPEVSPIVDRGVPNGRYVLYLGRVCDAKNTGAIIAAFRAYRRYRPGSQLKLVLAGGGESVEQTPGLFVLGRVTERQKRALLQSCAALFQPSVNESFSRSVMEAWSYGKPVAVNERCAPTAEALSECGGGRLAADLHEWIAAFSWVERSSTQSLREAGHQGNAHYRRHGTRDGVLRRYRTALGLGRCAPAAAAG